MHPIPLPLFVDRNLKQLVASNGSLNKLTYAYADMGSRVETFDMKYLHARMDITYMLGGLGTNMAPSMIIPPSHAVILTPRTWQYPFEKGLFIVCNADKPTFHDSSHQKGHSLEFKTHHGAGLKVFAGNQIGVVSTDRVCQY